MPGAEIVECSPYFYQPPGEDQGSPFIGKEFPHNADTGAAEVGSVAWVGGWSRAGSLPWDGLFLSFLRNWGNEITLLVRGILHLRVQRGEVEDEAWVTLGKGAKGILQTPIQATLSARSQGRTGLRLWWEVTGVALLPPCKYISRILSTVGWAGRWGFRNCENDNPCPLSSVIALSVRKALTAEKMERNGNLIDVEKEFYLLNIFLIYASHPEKYIVQPTSGGEPCYIWVQPKKIFFQSHSEP